MSGITSALSIAKDALFAQQIGLNTTGNNIANVNNPDYCRQTAVQNAKTPVLSGGLLIGSGVYVEQIQRSCDQFLESRLAEQKSGLAASEQTGSYLSVMEAFFNENSESSLSGLMTDFWNSWNELSNNPAGASERVAVYENAERISDAFVSLNSEFRQMQTELTFELEAGIEQVNALSEEIAALNSEIVGIEAVVNANDQRDQRNALVSSLSELIDVQTFEKPDGSLTVTTAKGYPIVIGAEAYALELSEGSVKWESSTGAIDITDQISSGRIGGWLEMRDAVLPKYKADLDSFAGEFIWAVNEQHSQGVGLDYFTASVTGTYSTDESGKLSTLAYGDKIDYAQDFKMWIRDNQTVPSESVPVVIDMGISTAEIDTDSWAGTADASGTPPCRYRLTVTKAGTVDADPTNENPEIKWEKIDSTGSLSASGTVAVNSGTIRIDDASDPGVAGITFNIGLGELVAGNTFSLNTDAAGAPDPLKISVSGTANSISDTYRFKVVSGAGTIGTDTIEVEWTSVNSSGTFALKVDAAYPVTVQVDGMSLEFESGTVLESDSFTVVTDERGAPALNRPTDWGWTLDSFKNQFNAQATGMGVTADVTDDHLLTFTPEQDHGFAFSDDGTEHCGLAAALGINTFFTGEDTLTIGINSVLDEKSYIAAAVIDADTGEFGVGDNSNAMAIADLQNCARNIAQWETQRGQDSRSGLLNTTFEGYYQSMIGSIGITSADIARDITFSTVMVNNISEQRDAVSAVSLDEEMINLMKYQHAYTVAAKLMSVADEMLESLIETR